ncbi:hypothetical protein EYZ11_011240 [Aspergillus tanneri]|uniref:Uncharacterized protein n=1 Tax=Aspergillus tanneri TaxID=1220188 RepID=A0A4S3J395_9EURO|nr:hypothetical protein EYZ11_011240 [Aspergillus tanneri]
MEIVKAGDILFCEKAFSPAFHDANEFRQGLAFLINAKTDAMTVGTQAELIVLIFQKLYQNTSLMPTYTNLYHGSYKPANVSEVDDIPVVNT